MENKPIKIASIVQHMGDRDLRVLGYRYLEEDVAGRSSHTYEARRRDLKKFFEFYSGLNGNLLVDDLQVRDTKLFIGYLHSNGYAPNSINRAIGTLRTFGRWLQDHGYVRLHPCRGIRDLHVDLGPPKAPRDRDFHRLLKTSQALATQDSVGRSQHRRDLVIVEALNASGLRVSELLSLKIDQFQGKKLLGVVCKGGKIRNVLIRQSVADLIRDYIECDRVGGSQFLFTSKNGMRLDRVTVWKALKRIALLTSAKFPHDDPIILSPHRLRHRHGFKARNLKDPVFAAKRLGHSSLNFIQRYTTETEEEENLLVEAMD